MDLGLLHFLHPSTFHFYIHRFVCGAPSVPIYGSDGFELLDGHVHRKQSPVNKPFWQQIRDPERVSAQYLLHAFDILQRWNPYWDVAGLWMEHGRLCRCSLYSQYARSLLWTGSVPQITFAKIAYKVNPNKSCWNIRNPWGTVRWIARARAEHFDGA